MILVPRGTVRIGSPESALDWLEAEKQAFPREWFSDETPQQLRDVNAFHIDDHPVTNEEFSTFVRETGYTTDAERRGVGVVYNASYWTELSGAAWHSPGGDGTGIADRLDHPVVHMSWRDASAYATWCGKRLPTETEWEYAARGGEYARWPWGEEWDPDRCNSAEWHVGRPLLRLTDWLEWWTERHEIMGSIPATTAIGTFPAQGPFGVGDTAGNVYEWTASLCEPYGARFTSPTFEALQGRFRVLRGGSWMNFRYQCRSSDRMYGDPDGWSNFAVGFRCARDV